MSTDGAAPRFGRAGDDVATDAVAAFARAWVDADTPPALRDFLPHTADQRTAAYVDLIRVDLQHRWLRAGTRKRLRDYCAEFADLDMATLPPDLVYEEFVIRRHSGERVTPDDC